MRGKKGKWIKNNNNNMIKKDFFISFRNKNSGASIAKNIHEGLDKAGYTNYYNPQQHNQELAGYPKRLWRNVKHSKVFVWILTEDSMTTRKKGTDFYFAEIIWAHKYKKCIMPVMTKKFRNDRRKDISASNEFLKVQFTLAFDNLLKDDRVKKLLKEKDRKIVDKIVKKYFDKGQNHMWGSCDISEENPLENKIVPDIIDRVKRTRWVHPIKFRWIKMPIFYSVLLLVAVIYGGMQVDLYIKNLTVWDGTAIIDVDDFGDAYKGDGTAESPYQIETAKQLAWLAYSSEYDSFENVYFELKEDITLNEGYNTESPLNGLKKYTSLYSNGNDNEYVSKMSAVLGYSGTIIPDKDSVHEWLTIGRVNSAFSGIFLGNHHTIYGLYIDSKEDNYQGFFGKCSEKSRIVDLNIEVATVTGNKYVGIIAGMTEGSIDNCSVNSGILASGSYGGIIAGNAKLIANSSVSNGSVHCTTSSDVNAEYINFGGIVGSCDYLINSYAAAEFGHMDDAHNIGGLAGKVKKDLYNNISLGVVLSGWGGDYYVDNEEPISICDVIGVYNGDCKIPIKEKSIYYYNNGMLGIQMSKECYNRILSICEKYFTNVEFGNDFGYITVKDNKYNPYSDEYNPNAKLINRNEFEKIKKNTVMGLGEFYAHDYVKSIDAYNKISQRLQDKSKASDVLNQGLENIGNFKTSDLYKAMTDYGIDGSVIEMKSWILANGNIPILESIVNN